MTNHVTIAIVLLQLHCHWETVLLEEFNVPAVSFKGGWMPSSNAINLD